VFKKSSAWLLAAWLVSAMAAYSYTGEPTVPHGAAMPADCKKPCTDNTFLIFSECDDLLGLPGKCDKFQCMRNKVALTKCTPKDNAASGADACETKEVAEHWRWITLRKMPAGCPDGGPLDFSHGNACTINAAGAADGGGSVMGYTPCKTASCDTGDIEGFADQPEGDNSRSRCK